MIALQQSGSQQNYSGLGHLQMMNTKRNIIKKVYPIVNRNDEERISNNHSTIIRHIFGILKYDCVNATEPKLIPQENASLFKMIYD